MFNTYSLDRSDHQCIAYQSLKQQFHDKATSRSVRQLKSYSTWDLRLKLNTEI